MDIDDVFSKIGELGFQQQKILFCLLFQNGFFAFHMVHMVFIGAVPNHFSCFMNKAGKTVRRIDLCPAPEEKQCEKIFYDADYTSIVTEWKLICGQSYQAGMVQSLFMGGVLIGALIFGTLSDRFGRRASLALGLSGLAVFTIGSSFMASLESYTIMRILAGIFCGGSILVSFVLSTEVVGAGRRALISMLTPAVFAVGIMLFSLLAFHIREWRHLSLATSLPGLLALASMYMVPESPRWLLSQGRVQDAENILKVIAIKNGYPSKDLTLNPPEVSTAKTYGLLDVVKHGLLWKRTLILAYCWFVNSCCYYGLTMSAGSLSSSPYTSVTLSALVELPAYTATLALMARMGRRWMFCSMMMLGGVSCLSIMVASSDSFQITVLALTGKLAISSSFAIAYLYSAELYPTVIRNVAMGVTSMAARIGGIVAPLIISMSLDRPWLQFAVFGSLAFTAGVLAMGLPETAGKPMPETLADLEGNSERPVKSLPLTDDKIQLLQESSEWVDIGEEVPA